MRIGILTDSYKPYVSGVATSIFILAEGLIEKGHEVFIITPKFKNYKEYDKDYPYIIRIPGGLFIPKKGLRFIRYVPFVGRHLKMIEKLNLDVIHVHSELTMGKLALKAKRKLNIPLVYTVHTMYEQYMHFASKYLARKHPEFLMKIVKGIMERHITNSDMTIVPSEKIKDLMISYGIESDYQVVPTGIHLEAFKRETYKEEDILNLREKHNLNEDDFICLFVGRISLEKNIDTIIEGFKAIQNDKIKLLIVGGGPYFKDLKEKIKEENIKNIIFTGLVPWSDIGLYYQLGDVFVNASVSETQGLTYIEALAAATPLIVKYDVVLKDVLSDGENGFFFNEHQELTEIILNLYNDKELFKKVKGNTLTSVLKFDSKVFIENVLNVYDKAIIKNKK